MTINELIGVILIFIGLGAMLGFIKFARGYTRVFGIPVGIFLIILGAAIAGWIPTPWF